MYDLDPLITLSDSTDLTGSVDEVFVLDKGPACHSTFDNYG